MIMFLPPKNNFNGLNKKSNIDKESLNEYEELIKESSPEKILKTICLLIWIFIIGSIAVLTISYFINGSI